MLFRSQVVMRSKKAFAVNCGDGNAVYVTELQAENAKRLDVQSFLCGKDVRLGTVLGNE